MTSTLANIQLGTSVATLDGLAVIDADQIYDNNQPINLSQYVPYVGSTQLTNLNSQNIQTSHVPTTGNDLTNKTYVDGQTALLVPYTGGTANVVLTGTNKFQQAYNALTTDTTTVVNRQTLDSAISGLGAGILNSNNTWGNGNTNNFNSALKTVNAPFINPGINAESITAISPSTYT